MAMDDRQQIAHVTNAFTSVSALVGVFFILLGVKYQQRRRRYRQLLTRTPYRIRGDWFMRDVINGSNYMCLRVTRMHKATFFRFSRMLKERRLLTDTLHISVDEQVAMGLYILGHHSRIISLVTLFQRSGETISRYFKEFLKVVCDLSEEFIHLPPTTTPNKIASSSSYYPWFEDCIGSIDGTHIIATVPSDQVARFRGRKGVTQNVFAAVDFDLHFVYVQAGWEGVANDMTVLKDALSREDGFKVHEGKYYLADVGYTTMPGFVAPYRGCRYHLKDYSRQNGPRDCRELFNLRHAQLRNTVERAFGVLKMRFRILTTKSAYPFSTQVECVIACCILHNYIMRSHPTGDGIVRIHANTTQTIDDSGDVFEEYPQLNNVRDRRAQSQPWVVKRDDIAARMWADYNQRMAM